MPSMSVIRDISFGKASTSTASTSSSDNRPPSRSIRDTWGVSPFAIYAVSPNVITSGGTSFLPPGPPAVLVLLHVALPFTKASVYPSGH